MLSLSVCATGCGRALHTWAVERDDALEFLHVLLVTWEPMTGRVACSRALEHVQGIDLQGSLA